MICKRSKFDFLNGTICVDTASKPCHLQVVYNLVHLACDDRAFPCLNTNIAVK